MGGAVGPALASAVSNAGGLGMLALWYADPEALRKQIRGIRLTNHTADRGSDLPRLFSAGGPRSGRELGDSMHWHIGQSR